MVGRSKRHSKTQRQKQFGQPPTILQVIAHFRSGGHGFRVEEGHFPDLQLRRTTMVGVGDGRPFTCHRAPSPPRIRLSVTTLRTDVSSYRRKYIPLNCSEYRQARTSSASVASEPFKRYRPPLRASARGRALRRQCEHRAAVHRVRMPEHSLWR